MSSTENTEKYPNLGMLRVIAAISMLSAHWLESHAPPLFPQGQLAVDLFFMTEGFLAERFITCDENGTVRKVARRALDIYPLYLFSLVLGFFSVIPFVLTGAGGWSIHLWLRALAAGAAMLPLFSSLVHNSVFPLNPPSWAIVLELVGFVLLAMIQGRRRTLTIVTVWTIAFLVQLSLAAVWHDPNAGWQRMHYWGGAPRMVFAFFGGALLYHIYTIADSAIPKLHPIPIWSASIMIQFLTVHLIAWPLVTLAVPMIVLLGAASTRPIGLRPLGHRAEVWALPIYLLGFPIIVLCRTAQSYFGFTSGFAGRPFGLLLLLGSIVAGVKLYRACMPHARIHRSEPVG